MKKSLFTLAATAFLMTALVLLQVPGGLPLWQVLLAGCLLGVAHVCMSRGWP